ncbi:MAG: ectoine/hydroxyectoine ABC transporter substrate-binding protein EhuB [Rhodospirillales bacterium]|nr:ectoine/hydroxyectoine ABC transporter substrate-binding protein EhuB [Rhodospirillales bacterium]
MASGSFGSLQSVTAACSVLAVFVGVSLGAPGDAAAQSTLEKIKKAGVVRMAIAHEPPFTDYKPGGELTGASADLTREVMKKLGVPKIDAQVTEWGAMIPGLQARRFDIISTGLFMRPQRCAAVLFSQPDTCTARGFAVKKGNPKKLDSMEAVRDNKEVKLGVCGGCFDETRAIEVGVPRERIVNVTDILNALKMLQAGRVDAVAWPDISIKEALPKLGDPNLEWVTVKGIEPQCSGAAFHKDDKDLRDAYDAVLKDMKASGQFSKIMTQYNFNPDYAIAHTREKFCGGPN